MRLCLLAPSFTNTCCTLLPANQRANFLIIFKILMMRLTRRLLGDHPDNSTSANEPRSLKPGRRPLSTTSTRRTRGRHFCCLRWCRPEATLTLGRIGRSADVRNLCNADISAQRLDTAVSWPLLVRTPRVRHRVALSYGRRNEPGAPRSRQ
jgi:hypothetical protein